MIIDPFGIQRIIIIRWMPLVRVGASGAGPHPPASYGLGMFRRFERAIETTSPSPPPSTSLLMATVNPAT